MDVSRKEVKNQFQCITGKFDKNVLKNTIEKLNDDESICFISKDLVSILILKNATEEIAAEINLKYDTSKCEDTDNEKDIYFSLSKNKDSLISIVSQDPKYLINSKYVGKIGASIIKGGSNA